MVNPPTQKSSSNHWAHHACLTFWHKHRTKVCCCKQAPSLIPRKATHPKVLVEFSKNCYNWTILRKLPALALCSSASVPSIWLLLFLVASSFYEQTICAFSNCNASPTDNFMFFKRNAIVSLWLSQKVWAQVPIHDKHNLNCFPKKSV